MNVETNIIYFNMFLYAIKLLLFSIVSTATVAAPTNGTYKNPNYLPGHDVMVHLFEWKWEDIARECETFLGPMGYGGVQVSPIQENIVLPYRPWWERYQTISYRWITRSGNEEEFRDMVRRCNNAGVRIYVDAILNHMTADQSFEAIGTGNSTADPPARYYASVPYERSHFHIPCAIDDYCQPIQIRNCDLNGLHDLDQSHEYVREKIVDFMNAAIDAGVAGFRIDAAKHIWPYDLNLIYSRLNNLNTNHSFPSNTRPYIYQEVIDMGGESISKREYNDLASVTEFRYGLEISVAMKGYNPLKWFRHFGELWGFLPNDDAFVFIDNHDNQRGHGAGGPILSFKESKLYKMAIAFMLAYPFGTPRIMSSYAFSNVDQGPPSDQFDNILAPTIDGIVTCINGWICEHRWRQIYNMVRFRIVVKNSEISEWWDNGNNQIAFSRGNVGFIAINAENNNLNQIIHTQLPSGIYCDIISGNIKNSQCTGKTLTVDNRGYVHVKIPSNAEDGMIAFHVNAKL